MGYDVEKIENRVNLAVAANTTVSRLGGIAYKNMGEVLEASKLMSISGAAVPKFLRGEPGQCFAVVNMALDFDMSPFAVAQHVFLTRDKSGDERLACDSTIFRALISAKLRSPIIYTYKDEGDERTCTATITIKRDVFSHTSATFGKLRARANAHSPLWKDKPDVQMAYDTGRDLCRIYFPHVLLGFRDADDIAMSGDERETSGIGERLSKKEKGAKGFDSHKITQTIEGEIVSSDAATKGASVEASPDKAGAAQPPEPTPVPVTITTGPAEFTPEQLEKAKAAGARAFGKGLPFSAVPANVRGKEIAEKAWRDGYNEALAARDKEIKETTSEKDTTP